MFVRGSGGRGRKGQARNGVCPGPTPAPASGAGRWAWLDSRKEVIQPQLPLRLPCYDFTPITDPTLDGSLLAVRPPASGVAGFRGVTGGVYKAREHIHRGVLTRDYEELRLHAGELQPAIRTETDFVGIGSASRLRSPLCRPL